MSGEQNATTLPTPGDIGAALRLAASLGATLPTPGSGNTALLWETLASIAAVDLGIVRAVEPHLDAIAILGQWRDSDSSSQNLGIGASASWGVFAAEGSAPLTAIPPTDASETGWTLTGTKPWCSLAGVLDAALVSATLPDGSRRLFAVNLALPGVRVAESGWLARGLTEIPSGPVTFDNVPAVAIGDAGWYLDRPGFSWGAIGVAACWFGGAVGIGRTLFEAARAKPGDPFLLMHLGAVDELLQSSRRALREAAELVDAGEATGPAGKLLSRRVRATVVRASEEILDRAAHALGPAPLAMDAAHAKRVADLQLYLRQDHAEKDLAALGGKLLDAGVVPW